MMAPERMRSRRYFSTREWMGTVPDLARMLVSARMAATLLSRHILCQGGFALDMLLR